MNIDLSQEMKNMEGVAYKEKDEDGNVHVWTVKKLLVNALLTPSKTENPASTEKYSKYVLAQKMSALDAMMDLTAEEVTVMKKSLDMYDDVYIYGKLVDIIEGR